jgi:hypothetical protein
MEQVPLLRGVVSGPSGNELSRELGQKWKEMSSVERRPYQERALAIAREFREKNPDYHYCKSRDKHQSRSCRMGLDGGDDVIGVFGVDVPPDGSEHARLGAYLHAQLMAQYVVQNKKAMEQIISSISPNTLRTILNRCSQGR